MELKFNNEKPLILDGGMGQTLLKQGMISQGTLWSASALLDGSLHQMVINAHQEFMKAGAKVITTNNFTVRKLRFSENNILDKFEEAMHTAGRLAKQAKQENTFLGMCILQDQSLLAIKPIWPTLNYQKMKFYMNFS